MKPSKLLISTLVVVALMASADGVSHAQKKSTFFIPVSERNYAQKLGGYSMDDYSLYEGNIDYSKKKNKPLIQEKVFSSYQEAFDKADAKTMLISALANTGIPVVAASGLAGFGKSNDIRVRKAGQNLYLVGDLISGVSPELAPASPRVGIAAAMEANTVVALLLDLAI